MDLTCEGSECAVVDLTNNDSVLVTTQLHACVTHTHTLSDLSCLRSAAAASAAG